VYSKNENLPSKSVKGVQWSAHWSSLSFGPGAVMAASAAAGSPVGEDLPVEETSAAPIVNPNALTDSKPLEDYLLRVCPPLLDLDADGTKSAFENFIADAAVKAKLKIFVTDSRAPVLLITKRLPAEGIHLLSSCILDCVTSTAYSFRLIPATQ
jgi:hypothetical protein